MLRTRHLLRTAIGGMAIALLSHEAAYGQGCPLGVVNGVQMTTRVLKSFTTVSSSSLDLKAIDFANNNLFSLTASSPQVVSKSLFVEQSVMTPGGSWTVKDILGGPGTVMNCGAPVAGATLPPLRVNAVRKDPTQHTWMKRPKAGGGGGGGGCGAGAGASAGSKSTVAAAPVASPPAQRVLIKVAPGFAAKDIHTVLGGPSKIGGIQVNSYVTTITVQMNPTQSQVFLLESSFAPGITDPAVIPCQTINLAASPPVFVTNAGPDAAVQTLMGTVLGLEQIVPSAAGSLTVTLETDPSITTPLLDSKGLPILDPKTGNVVTRPAALPNRKFLMYAKLKVFAINADPATFPPAQEFVLENGNLI